MVGQNRRARAIGKQARADQNAGIVVEKKGRTANFDADGQNFFGAPGGNDGFGRAQIWQCRAAALPDQIERENIFAQAKLFADVTGEAGTKIAGAGADEHGVNFFRGAIRIFQRALCGLDCQRGRVFGEAGLQRVGRLVENFRNWIEREMARVNAVVTAEDFFEDGARTGFELRKLRPVLQRVPAFSLGVAVWRNGGAEADKKHGGL